VPFKLFLAVSLPAVAFLAAWRAAERWFEVHRVPMPFERYGAVLGLGAAFFALGTVLLVWHFTAKRRQS
jgi:hypothetical protein